MILLASILFAFSPSRWAFSERGPEARGGGNAVTRGIKADIFAYTTRPTFDRLWAFAPPSSREPPSPVIYFASADPVSETVAPFDAVLSDPEGVELILRDGLTIDPLALAGVSAQEQKCLTDAVYFEARGETQAGQAAVAQVVLNRVRSRHYPNTICGVVYQNQDMLNRCQFSFACDGAAERVVDRRSWARAVDVARKVLLGREPSVVAEVANATHYHATSVSPVWAGEMRRVDTIGSHIFYETGRRGSRS
jgi:hypothetical protein